MIGATCDARSAALGAAGLVPYKTSLSDRFINLSPPDCALRRIARLKRSVWCSGHLHGISHLGVRAPVAWFVTLTYANAHGWRADHISFAIHQFRKWCMRRRIPCRYTWVAEIQPKRLERTGDAVPHYHLLAWLPVGVAMPHWDAPGTDARPCWWPHGMSKTEVARSGVGYLMKYLSKLGEFHRFPKGLRLYGIGGLDLCGRGVRSWYNLPEWAKRSYGVGQLVRRGGRLLVSDTGEILEPAFRVSLVPGGLVLRQLRELPQGFHDGAYSAVSL